MLRKTLTCIFFCLSILYPHADNIVFVWKKDMVGKLIADSITININNDDANRGLLPGKFYVSENKCIRFSKGNLQYQPSTNTFRFANHQAHSLVFANEKISNTTQQWLDLFGFGTSGYKGCFPYNSSKDTADYASNNTNLKKSHFDWGRFCFIENSGEYGSWATLSYKEWEYLLNNRKDAEKLRLFATIDLPAEEICYADYFSELFGKEVALESYSTKEDVKNYLESLQNTPLVKKELDRINKLNPDTKSSEIKCVFPKTYSGLVLLPDDWSQPKDINIDFDSQYPHKFSAKEWAEMEHNGAVFISFGGIRQGNDVSYYKDAAFYWTSDNSMPYLITQNDITPSLNYQLASNGLSVRLVKYEDAQTPQKKYNLECKAILENGSTVSSSAIKFTGEGEYWNGTTASISCELDSNYVFVCWEDGDTASIKDIVVTCDTTINAYLKPKGQTTIQDSDSVGIDSTAIIPIPDSTSIDSTSGKTEAMIKSHNCNYHFVTWRYNHKEYDRVMVATSVAILVAPFEEYDKKTKKA